MAEAGYRRLDGLAAALLLLWAGLALSLLLLPIPAPWAHPGDGGLPRLVMADWVLRRLDMLSFVGFGLPLLLVWLPRFLAEQEDGTPIGPLRLWSAAALAALLVCFASVAIMGPRLALAHASAPADPVAWGKAAGLARQFLVLRLILALGLAAGTAWLPRQKVESEAAPVAEEPSAEG
ncbi:MAG TPA: hypothetical protein PKO12_04060 [Holophaga sp.]|jgi:hypothetical protein|nr:hypothetical protein [Holophaga sp.]HQL47286.1 hypothetical protein [Holophaga sp.]